MSSQVEASCEGGGGEGVSPCDSEVWRGEERGEDGEEDKTYRLAAAVSVLRAVDTVGVHRRSAIADVERLGNGLGRVD